MKQKFFYHLLSVFDFLEESFMDNLPGSEMYNENFRDGEKITKIDDSFTGMYNGVKFEILEVFDAYMRSKMGVYATWSGVIINLDFNKLSKTKIFISPKSDIAIYILIVVSIILSIGAIISLNLFFIAFAFFITYVTIKAYITGRNKRIDLEDNDFHKKYYVEAEDQIEARYILTPSFMERLKNIETAYGSGNINCYIENNKMSIAIATKRDLFEVGNIYIPVSDSKQVRQFYDEVLAICDLIDYFKLNERTGL